MKLIERTRLHNDLFNIITESFNSVNNKQVNEALKKRKKNIYTISAMDIDEEESVDDMQYTGVTYYTEEDAIENARQMAEEWKDSENCVCITVYAGEYELANGNTEGEPFDIYTISNKSKEETILARENAGYVALEVDEYIA